MASASQSFVVREPPDALSVRPPDEVVVMVSRAHRSLRFEMVSALRGSSHWSESLPLPDPIAYEIVHVETATIVSGGTYSRSQSPRLVDGSQAGIYVGERYRLRIPPTEFVDESAVDVAPTADNAEGGDLLVVPVQRAFATVVAVLRSEHADTPTRWDARLPMPAGIPLRLVHVGLNKAVAAGTTDGRSRAEFAAASKAIVVGEQYSIVVGSSERCESAEDPPFTLASRAVEVASLVRRRTGKVTIGMVYARAGSGHWSSALDLPDGIAFNIHHKGADAARCPTVDSGATKRAQGDTCHLYGDEMGDGLKGQLYVGETYIVEVPGGSGLRPTSKEFTVNSEANQLVTVPVARQIGRVQVHLHPGESGLPLPSSITLNLRHKGLDLRVMPPFPVASERSELFGEDTLMVGQTYELEASAHGDAIHRSATEFTVRAEPVRVDLSLERNTAELTLVFRAAPPAKAARHGSGHWSTGIELPEGLIYEVYHKASNKKVATGATRTREATPRVVMRRGLLYIGETYLLKVLPAYGLEGGRCEFYVRSADEQEVTLQVQRSTCGTRVKFVPFEERSRHWAAKLALPSHVPFEVVHKATGATVHKGDGGPSNECTLPSDVLFTGESYVLQSLSSRLLLASRCDFVVGPKSKRRSKRSSASASAHRSRAAAVSIDDGGGSGVAVGGGGVRYDDDDDDEAVVLHVERAVGDVRFFLRAADERPLPVRVPYTVTHADLSAVVVDGATAVSGVEVECDPWFVNDGALFEGQTYTFTVPKGNGFAETSKTFTVGEKSARALAAERRRGTRGGGGAAEPADGRAPTIVELELAREFASASVHLVSSKAGSGHWSEPLPLPSSMHLYVRLASDYKSLVGHKHVELHGSKAQDTVRLDGPKLQIVAHQRYTLELQRSEVCERSTAELVVTSGAVVASCQLLVSRAWRPAVVVVLRASDAVSLPANLRVRVLHSELRCVVAECVTTESDTEVRCVLQVAEAFYMGESYACDVESPAQGVGGASAHFTVYDAMEDVVIDLSRASAQVKARAFPLLPAVEHWSKELTMQPQTLEVHHNRQLVATTSIAWAPGATDLVTPISGLTPIFLGHTYTLKVVQSASVDELVVSLVGEQAAQIVDLPLRRRSFPLAVTLRSRQELPLPYGIKVRVRHRGTACLVAEGLAGEVESRKYEADVSSALQESTRADGDVQAADALRRVREFMRDNDIIFNGAGDAGLPRAEQAWAINHLDPRYKAQNWRTIDGIASILRDFDQIALEVHGETGPAEHAPENLAAHFGLDRTRDVQRVMDRLAECRAEACRQALVLRGVKAERLFVSFKGRGGRIRTDFIPRSMHDSAQLATSVTQVLAPHSTPGALVFQSPAERGLQSTSQAWAIEHTDAAHRMQNRQTLEAVASTLLRYPLLHLEARSLPSPAPPAPVQIYA